MLTTDIVSHCAFLKCSRSANQQHLLGDLPEGIVTDAQLRNGWTLVGSEYLCPAHSPPSDIFSSPEAVDAAKDTLLKWANHNCESVENDEVVREFCITLLREAWVNDDGGCPLCRQ